MGNPAPEPNAVNLRLAVVIPCYRVSDRVGEVLRAIGPEVWRVYCVDDACPEGSGQVVAEAAKQDPRISLITHERNQGVGGAVVSGYRQALADGADIIVKIDGDGQMDPRQITELIDPLLQGQADYVKGNRFFHLESLRSMPWVRLMGNAGLSFLSKLATGYWDLFDPTNGYTAVHAPVLRIVPLEKLARRYFFESDLLFRLGTVRAVIADVPMDARYADEESSLRPLRSLVEFPIFHMRNFVKRIFYNYYLRGFSVASINLAIGLILLVFGVVFGSFEWIRGAQSGAPASSGTVMLAGMPIILGCQLLLNFISHDVANVPRDVLHRKLRLGGYR